MKKQILVVIAGILLVGGGAVAYTYSQNNKDEAVEANSAMDDAVKNDEPKVENSDESIKPGTYVTLADYDANPTKYSDTTKVYFFHAGWCPICRGIDKEITADPSRIPAGVTVIKTDFDSSTDLRKKYGVTYQYTFVQVDGSGNKTAKWSATNLDKALAGIKS